MARCEDAPCCGCCGTNLYGASEESRYPDEFYDGFYEEYYD